MYRHKPYYYLNKLREKGWTNEEIAKKTRIHPLRLEKLYLPGTSVTREEIKKVNALFRLTPPKNLTAVKAMWEGAGNKPEKKYDGPALTARQKEILQQLRDSTHKEVILTPREAMVAGRLVEPGLVKRRLDEGDDDSPVRFYSITVDGLTALQSFGL